MTTDPYEGYPKTIIDADTIVGYAYKYLDKYLRTKVIGEDFLPVLFAVLEVESEGFNKYIRAKIDHESSYGLFQINWGAHHDTIYEDYPQFREAGISNTDVKNMSIDEHAKFIDIIADLDFQFQYAKDLMDRKSGRNRNIFEDWSAYTDYPIRENGTGPYKTKMPSYIRSSNIYLEKDDRELFGFAKQNDAGFKKTPGLSRDLSTYEPANSNMFTGEPTVPEEQWKQIKQYYGKDYYDYENDKWIPGAEKTTGFKEWSFIMESGIVGDPDTTYSDFLENTAGDIRGLVEETFGKVTAQTGFDNPFRISALSGPPTVADTIKIAVMERYAASAFDQGFSKSVSEALAITHLANGYTIDLMDRAVTKGLDSALGLPEMVDLVSQSVASYTLNNENVSWIYRLPEFKDARIPEQNAIYKRINDKVSSVLLINDPGLTDQIKSSYTDYKIMNPNTQVSIEDFSMPFIKDTRRYNRIYQQKPPQFSEEQYIGQYSNAVGGAMGLGDPGFNNAVTSSASVGATTEETQTAATFGSPGVGLGDTFRDKVSALGERIGGMFNK